MKQNNTKKTLSSKKKGKNNNIIIKKILPESSHEVHGSSQHVRSIAKDTVKGLEVVNDREPERSATRRW